MMYKFFHLLKQNNVNILLIILSFFLCSCFAQDKKVDGKRIKVFKDEDFIVSNVQKESIVFPNLTVKKDWKSSFGNVEGLHKNNSFSKKFEIFLRKKTDNSPIISTPISYKKNVIILTEKGNVFSLDEYGNEVWKTSVVPYGEKEGFLLGGGISADNSLIVVSTSFGEILALSSKNGKILWRNNFDGSFNMGVTIYNEKIYVISSKGLALCLNLNGDVIWSFLGPSVKNNIMNEPNPVVFSNNILFPFNSGVIKLLDLKTGEEIWSFESQKYDFGNARSIIKGFSSSLIVSKDEIFLSSYSGETIALNENGKIIWANNLNTNDDLLLLQNNLFLIDRDNRLVNINSKNGEVIWAKEFSKQKPSYIFGLKLINSKIAILDENGNLIFYDINKDEFKTFSIIKDEVSTNLIIVSNNLFFGSKKGHLIALR